MDLSLTFPPSNTKQHIMEPSPTMTLSIYEPAMSPGDLVRMESNSSLYFTLTLQNEFLSYNVTVVAVTLKD